MGRFILISLRGSACAGGVRLDGLDPADSREFRSTQKALFVECQLTSFKAIPNGRKGKQYQEDQVPLRARISIDTSISFALADRSVEIPILWSAAIHVILLLVPATTIHFVCTGNIYRSRLAEAYCASRRVAGIHVFSSGIGAGFNGDAAISPYAAELLARYGLASHAAAHWQRTTEALVRASDVLVFMEAEHRRFCEKWIEPVRQRFEVWEIEDVGPIDAAEIPNKVERTFGIIRQRIDTLLSSLVLRNVKPTQ